MIVPCGEEGSVNVTVPHGPEIETRDLSSPHQEELALCLEVLVSSESVTDESRGVWTGSSQGCLLKAFYRSCLD